MEAESTALIAILVFAAIYLVGRGDFWKRLSAPPRAASRTRRAKTPAAPAQISPACSAETGKTLPTPPLSA